MGLISGLIGLPFAPLRGTVWVAEQVAAEAEKRLNDPAALRRRLEAVVEAKRDGRISEEDARAEEREIIQQLMRGRRAAGRR